MEIAQEVRDALSSSKVLSEDVFSALCIHAGTTLVAADAAADFRELPAVATCGVDPVILHNTYTAIAVILTEAARHNLPPSELALLVESSVPSVPSHIFKSLSLAMSTAGPAVRAALIKRGTQLPSLTSIACRFDHMKSPLGPTGEPVGRAAPQYAVQFNWGSASTDVSDANVRVGTAPCVELISPH